MYQEYRDMFLAAQSNNSPYVMFTIDIQNSSKMPSAERYEAQEYLIQMFNEVPKHIFSNQVTRKSSVDLFQGDAAGFWTERHNEDLLLTWIKEKLKDAPFSARVAKGYFETVNWLEGNRLYYAGYCFEELTHAHKEDGVGSHYIVLIKF